VGNIKTAKTISVGNINTVRTISVGNIKTVRTISVGNIITVRTTGNKGKVFFRAREEKSVFLVEVSVGLDQCFFGVLHEGIFRHGLDVFHLNFTKAALHLREWGGVCHHLHGRGVKGKSTRTLVTPATSVLGGEQAVGNVQEGVLGCLVGIFQYKNSVSRNIPVQNNHSVGILGCLVGILQYKIFSQ
jgi:hypothetical protein